VGCNPNVPGGCITRNPLIGNLTEIFIAELSTSDEDGNTYTYWKINLLWQTSAGTCSFDDGQAYLSNADAVNEVGSFWPIGKTEMIMFDVNTRSCQLGSESMATWIAGIFFLCARVDFLL